MAYISIVVAALFIVHTVSSQSCSQYYDNKEQCQLRVYQTPQYKALNQKEIAFGQKCAQQNPSWQTCLKKLEAVQQCQEQIRGDKSLNAQKLTAAKAIDQCYQTIQQRNHYYILHPLASAKEAVKRARPPAATSRRRRQTVSSTADPCEPFEACVLQAELASGNDATSKANARSVYDAEEACKQTTESFDCLPTTPELAKCIAQASNSFQQAKRQQLQQCIKGKLA